MTCDEARERFSALVDGALERDEAAAVARHLEGCADCRREHDRLVATVSLLHRVVRARAPAGFVDRVLEVARKKPWYERFTLWPARRGPIGLPLGALAMLVIAGLAVYVFQRSPELQRAAREEAPVAAPSETARPERPAAPPPSAPPGEGARGVPAPRPGMDRQPPSEEAERKQEKPPAQDLRGAEPASRPRPGATEGSPPAKTSAGSEGVAVGAHRAPGPSSPAEGEAAPAEGGAAESPAPAAPAVAPAREKAARDAQRQALASRPPPAAAAPPDVVGRLSVGDRAAARRALAELAGRIGGSQIPAAAADEGLVELTLPREAYGAFLEGLGRIGRWAPEREVAPLPAQIRLSIRLSP